FARHGCAVDAVAPGLGSDINDRVAFSGRARVENLIAPDQSQRKRVHQRIARVARLKLNLATEVRHTKAISVRSDAANHAFHNGMVLVNLSLGWRCLRRDSRPRLSSRAQLGRP